MSSTLGDQVYDELDSISDLIAGAVGIANDREQELQDEITELQEEITELQEEIEQLKSKIEELENE